MLEKQVAGMNQLVERSIRSDARLDGLERRVVDIEQDVAEIARRK